MAALGITACANTPSTQNTVSGLRPYLPIEISVQGDNSGSLPAFPVSGDSGNYRAYLQAVPNERYKLRISNNSDQRVGVVIAVDGRNIISGQKSYLYNTERMYILEPHASSEYEGWRTGANQVNRFYFTEASNSYAAAWGDNSAMGVIAMAVYPERPRPEVMNQLPEVASGAADRAMAPSAPYKGKAAPGTGFGETNYSPSQLVSFEPLPDALEKVFLKYEWRETLCQKKIISACQNPSQTHENRFWPDNNGYAPPPPPRRY
jgi:hypothetical protein